MNDHYKPANALHLITCLHIPVLYQQRDRHSGKAMSCLHNSAIEHHNWLKQAGLVLQGYYIHTKIVHKTSLHCRLYEHQGSHNVINLMRWFYTGTVFKLRISELDTNIDESILLPVENYDSVLARRQSPTCIDKEHNNYNIVIEIWGRHSINYTLSCTDLVHQSKEQQRVRASLTW